MSISIPKLALKLGYEFKDQTLADTAYTHRSFAGKNYERIEFLGDSILNFIIAEWLYDRFPQAAEGQLSRLRAVIVKGVTLAQVAKEMQLGDFLLMGSGELKSGGFRRDSILADVVESTIGAIYQEAGFEVAKERILAWFGPRLEQLDLSDTDKDPKTRLQEFLQSRQAELPEYQVVSTTGKAHDQLFKVQCKHQLLEDVTFGTGSSRRRAEQESAQKALELLNVKPERFK